MQVTVVCAVIEGFCNVDATCSHTLKIFYAKLKPKYVENFFNCLARPDAVSCTYCRLGRFFGNAK